MFALNQVVMVSLASSAMRNDWPDFSAAAERGSGGEQQYGLRNESSRNQLRHNRADGRHRHDDSQ